LIILQGLTFSIPLDLEKQKIFLDFLVLSIFIVVDHVSQLGQILAVS
jgi:hypothetical protein